ncbi:MAG: SDR family NAD(P)-dependent oxidoreductase, partial [Alphaproteobacteria bacterium]|nr:SDR family NAD(P)-dependent oxidoreductase [Alphaproteobacteria bacterium]
MAKQETAFIIGVGPGLSASLARLFASEGMSIALGARNVDKLDALARETDAARFAIDVADPDSVDKFFADAVADKGVPDIVVYNPSARTRGPFIEQDP